MKKKIIIGVVIVIVLIGGLFGFKFYNFAKWNIKNIDIDKLDVFLETYSKAKVINLENREKDGSIEIEGLNIRNDFIDFVVDDISDPMGTGKRFTIDNEAIVIISRGKQYLTWMQMDSDTIGSNDKLDIGTSTNRKNFLEEKKITNDLELIDYLVKNRNYEAFVGTKMQELKERYYVYSYASIIFPQFDLVTIIDGDFKGYIGKLKDSNTWSIYIYKDDEMYTLTFMGSHFTNQYIEDITKTIYFN